MCGHEVKESGGQREEAYVSSTCHVILPQMSYFPCSPHEVLHRRGRDVAFLLVHCVTSGNAFVE